MARIALLATLAALLLAPAAGAATLRITPSEHEYTAAPGEANDVTVRITRLGDGRVRTRLRDDGASISVDALPGRCDVIDEHEVECFGTGRLLTGDGDDRVRIVGNESPVAVWLGAGDDLAVDQAGFAGLVGEEGDDQLTGGSLEGGEGADRLTLAGRSPGSATAGPGDDVVTGSDLRDSISAGPGADRVAAGGGDDDIRDTDDVPPGPDEYDGGAGIDTLYLPRPTPVWVSLPAGVAVSNGERDGLTGIEGAVTGDGDDVLLGASGAEILHGGAGDDRIDGGGGDDLLTAGWGDDVVMGGPGNDVLDGDERNDPGLVGYGFVPAVTAPDRDVLDGGAGDDRVAIAADRWVDRTECGDGADAVDASTVDRVMASCETVRRSALPSLFASHRSSRGPWVAVRGRRAVVQVPCEISGVGGVAELRRRGRVLGRRKWRCAADPDLRLVEPSHGLGIRLARRTARRLRRTGRLGVRVVMRWEDGSVPSRERTALVLRR